MLTMRIMWHQWYTLNKWEHEWFGQEAFGKAPKYGLERQYIRYQRPDAVWMLRQKLEAYADDFYKFM